MQNVVVSINSIEEAYDISLKAVNMYLIRLCIVVVLWKEMRRLADNKSEDLKLQFVYAGDSFWGDNEKLLSFMFTGMKKHNLKEVMMTILRMERKNLITKEKMESFCEGKKLRKESVNEDLESLFERIRLGKQPEVEEVRTYFVPKLTEKEL